MATSLRESHSRQSSHLSQGEREDHSEREHHLLAHSRQSSLLSTLSDSFSSSYYSHSLSSHSRQTSLLSSHRSSPSSHSRVSSLLSDSTSPHPTPSFYPAGQTHGLPHQSDSPQPQLRMQGKGNHCRQQSASSSHSRESYDNQGFSYSPPSRPRQQGLSASSSDYNGPSLGHGQGPGPGYGHSHGLGPHSRQGSYDRPLMRQSPTPPQFKLPPSFSPQSADLGYHTMVGQNSSPSLSPAPSLDLSSIPPCPQGVTRPRPPAVPSTYRPSQEQPLLGKDQPPHIEDHLLKIDRISYVKDKEHHKDYFTRMDEERLRLPPSGREEVATTQDQIHHLTRDQIHLSTQEQSVSFVSRPSPLLLLPDKALLHLLRLLDALTLARLALTSKRLYHLCWSPALWKSVVLNGPVDADLALSCLLATLGRERGRGVVGRHCPALEHLDVHGCRQVTNEGVTDLLARCPGISNLNLAGCSSFSGLSLGRGTTRDAGVLHQADNLSLAMPNLSLQPGPTGGPGGPGGPRVNLKLHLTHLDLTDCVRLQDDSLRGILQVATQLLFLYLRRCTSITDHGIKLVSSYCYQLRELSISDCPAITDSSLLELARLGPSLRYLSAAKCHRITDVGVTAIARHCYKLRYLNVRGCVNVSDAAVEQLARSCASRLRSVDLGKCDLTDAGLQVLSVHSTHLKKVSVRGCEMVGDIGVSALARACRGLQQLNIQDCTGVTLAGYRTVKRHCQRCIIEHTNPGFH